MEDCQHNKKDDDHPSSTKENTLAAIHKAKKPHGKCGLLATSFEGCTNGSSPLT